MRLQTEADYKAAGLTFAALADQGALKVLQYQLGQTSARDMGEYKEALPELAFSDVWNGCGLLLKAEVFIIDHESGGVPHFAVNPNMPEAALDIVLALWPDALTRYKPAEAE